MQRRVFSREFKLEAERMGLRRTIFGRLRARPVNRSPPKTPGNLPLSAVLDQAESMPRR